MLGLVQADLNKATSIESNDIVKVQEFDKVKEFSIMAAGEMCIFFLCVLFQHIKHIQPYQQYQPNEAIIKEFEFSAAAAVNLFSLVSSLWALQQGVNHYPRRFKNNCHQNHNHCHHN